ncbi:hypothetical protein CY0110_18952 [Crocosphaera chwakensis CCY0110]|uniref:Uncharacterized protein n=1 Tax=Crocosphaera chwakensis CCY0110 TaxID=391612 RepID=A3IJC2_9CHRO|nr:hypothetical protein CY0110_18952 [Crocosphaera chwakensis CCY0110]
MRQKFFRTPSPNSPDSRRVNR